MEINQKDANAKNILYFLEWMQLNRNFKVKEIPTFHTSTAYMMQFDDKENVLYSSTFQIKIVDSAQHRREQRQRDIPGKEILQGVQPPSTHVSLSI